MHRWALPYSEVWTAGQRPPVPRPVVDREIYWCGCKLFPNGDLLTVYTAVNDTPCGYGLVKLDKNSKVLWAYSGYVHHDFDVAEDGKIYVLTHQLYNRLGPGLEFVVTPCSSDTLVVLSPGGEELQKVPLLEVFRDSPQHAPMLSALTRVPPQRPNPSAPAEQVENRRPRFVTLPT